MSKSQTAISERTRKTCSSDLVWTGADFALILTQNTKWRCCLAANLSYFSGHLYLLPSGHPVERSWRRVTDVGSHRRWAERLLVIVLVTCRGYSTWCPTLVFMALSLPFSLRLISAPYHQTQDPEKISRRLRSRAAQVTGEMASPTGPG